MPLDREALRERLRALFVEELEDHVGVLNRGLLALERGDASVEQVQELFRSAHSLKGAASSADVPAAEAVAHRLEDVLARVRDGSLDPDDATIARLFAAVDAFAEMGRRMRAGDDPGGVPVAELLADLATQTGDRKEARAPVRPPAPPPAGRTVTTPALAQSEEPAHRDDAEGGATTARLPVRAMAERLESLLDRSGELLLASNQLHALAAELATVADLAAERSIDARTFRGTVSPAGERSRPMAASGPSGVPPQLTERLAALARTLQTTDRTVRRAAGDIVAELREASMVPFAHVCEGLDRLARDLATRDGKQVRLTVTGADVELDRAMVAALREPLLHLVRNAVAHGIEPAEDRRRAGKAPAGAITVDASLRGEAVEVTVSDDGRGIDVDALRSAAQRRGLATVDDDVLDLVFAHGVSTAALLTEVSGRGVGMDAVRTRVEGVGGAVVLDSESGAGTRVTLAVPAALSTVRVVLVRAGVGVLAIPSSAIVRLVRGAVGDLRAVDGRDTWLFDGRPLPVIPLADVLDLPVDRTEGNGSFTAVAVHSAGHTALLSVDELLGEQEVVMKPLGPRLAGLWWALGATIMGDGRVAGVVSAGACVRAASGRRLAPAPTRSSREPARRTRILLVEDTLTTRALERTILEAAGYDVVTAADGVEGWELLHGEDVDLVITDVELPRMDGFALCEAIRGSSRFRDVPVVVVTSLGSDQDRRRGIEVGANAYIVKSAFEEAVLLEAVERLL